MKSKLERALACATLSAALSAAAVWLPGASADQPATPDQREFVSDTSRGAMRTAVTGQCVRTGVPEAGSVVAGCIEAPVETAKTAPPPAPAQTAPEPSPDFVTIPEPADMVPVPPMQPVAEDDRIGAPTSFDNEEMAVAEAQDSADSNPAEGIAAADAAMAQEATPAPGPAPEPPAGVAEAPAPPAPQPPPETTMAPPAPPAQPERRRLRLAADTHFQFARAQLTPAGTAKLDKLADEIGAAQIGAITIVGYTDRIGSHAYNQKLSQQRAESVKQYLASRSVEANRIQAIGRGKSDPVTAPDTCKAMKGKRLIQCLAPDRRVEIEVVALAAPAR